MKNFFKKYLINSKESIKEVAEKQLEKNATIIKSLRDYDEGKKDISTSDLERRLPDIRIATRA